MTDPLPEYDNPPVVETVLGAQFDRIELTTPQAGWYWKSCLDDSWPKATEVVRLGDVIERFGEDREWSAPGIQIMPGKDPSQRLQIQRADGERMIQVQNSRFVYNWKKNGSSYPTYGQLLPEFKKHIDQFGKFSQEQNLGEIKFNQWEVVYVNQLPKGDLWNLLEDWPRIFPFFHLPIKTSVADDFTGTWQQIIGEELGRLYVEMRRAKNSEGAEVIRLQITARGGVDEKCSFYDGLDLGHETIVRAFTEMTSEMAHQHWKRRV